MTKHIDRKRRHLLKLIGATGLAFAVPMPLAGRQDPADRTNPIPSSGERLPVIGLGTSRVFDVGTAVSEREGPREVLRILATVSNSIVDSSPMYGRAEGVLGDLANELSIRNRLFYATKVWAEGKQAGIAQMQESMKLLKTDRIDLMQIHNLVDWETHIRTLRAWKARGIIRYLGITHYTESAHEAVNDIMRKEPMDFVQINYSLGEPEAANRILPLAQDKGIAVIANRPFARGALFRATRGKPLPAWAVEIDCKSWAQFFLKFVVSHPAVTCAIPGTAKARHMLDNQQAGTGRLPDTAMRQKMQTYISGIR